MKSEANTPHPDNKEGTEIKQYFPITDVTRYKDGENHYLQIDYLEAGEIKSFNIGFLVARDKLIKELRVKKSVVVGEIVDLLKTKYQIKKYVRTGLLFLSNIERENSKP